MRGASRAPLCFLAAVVANIDKLRLQIVGQGADV